MRLCQTVVSFDNNRTRAASKKLLKAKIYEATSRTASMTWFLLKDEEICGPFATSHVIETCDDSTLIWGPGMEEWTDKQSWTFYLSSPKKTEIRAVPAPVSDSPDESKSVEEVAKLALNQLNDKWYFAFEDKRYGPFNQSHLILKISAIEQVEKVLLWKKGEDSWRPLYEFPKILNILNEKLDEKKAA